MKPNRKYCDDCGELHFRYSEVCLECSRKRMKIYMKKYMKEYNKNRKKLKNEQEIRGSKKEIK